MERGAKVVLCSHLGRPDGKVVGKLKMTVVAQRLSQLLGKQVEIARDSIGADVEKAAEKLEEGNVLLLENLRFHSAEEEGSPEHAEALAKLADIYVDDAFGTAHRRHASIVGVTEYLPAVAGLLLEKEVDNLGGLMEYPAHPFGGLFGGAKVSDKVDMLENIMSKMDAVLIGGGMAATFLKARSCEVGLSLVETDRVEIAAGLMKMAEKNNVKLLLPVDVVVAEEISENASGEVVTIDSIVSNKRIVDIGPQTAELFDKELSSHKTIFWNGPMGIYEIAPFAEGTKKMARLLAGLGATTIIGGGSTTEIVTELGLAGEMTFVSTGGGATLSYLGGKKLPGVEALLDKDSPAALELR
jgi:phosphoglycerate kinase